MGKAEFRVVGDTAIGSILYKGMLVEFLVDAADLPKLEPYKWHYTSNSYIASSQRIGEEVKEDLSGSGEAVAAQQKKKEIYLHNFLMTPGQGQLVQHISKNGLDNRRRNLRLTDAAHHAPSEVSKKRTAELPPLCGIKPEDIPKHIWYVQANGYHRDRFAIELKTEKVLWKTTSSKKVSLQEKLQQAKAKLAEFYVQFPHLDPKREEELTAELQSSFEATLKG